MNLRWRASLGDVRSKLCGDEFHAGRRTKSRAGIRPAGRYQAAGRHHLHPRECLHRRAFEHSVQFVLREEAIAVRGDRIQAVGKAFDIQRLKGPQTEVIDLGGHFLMPGFNDAHLHLADAGATKLSVDLTGVKSLDDLRERVRTKVDSSKAGEWILGSGWDETLWPVKVTPTRWDLDEVAAGHPVFLVRIDGHIAVANTRALQLGSITLASRDPQGGHIDRNQNGEPTGILRETAQAAVLGVVPKPTQHVAP